MTEEPEEAGGLDTGPFDTPAARDPQGESPSGSPGATTGDQDDQAVESALPEGAGAGEATDAGQASGVEITDEVAQLQTQLAERTADLQRLQAEFVNYKRRVDRDREVVQQNAGYRALSPIVEVLDTIDRAREHGPLEEGLKAVAEQLERAVASAGLVRFGAVGDAFDPTLHEALSHIGEDPEVDVTTCKVIAKAGYRIGDRVVRAAQVLVVDPPSQAEVEEVAQQPSRDRSDVVEGSTTGEPDDIIEGETHDEEVHQEE